MYCNVSRPTITQQINNPATADSSKEKFLGVSVCMFKFPSLLAAGYITDVADQSAYPLHPL
jgi:hypothetical protein